METVSDRQKRLFSEREGGRTLDGMVFMDLADLLEERAEVGFARKPSGLREVLDLLLSIGTFLRIDVGTAVQRKYRNMCPRCSQKPCGCWNKSEKPAYVRYEENLPEQLSLWETQRMLNEIFPHRHTLEEEIQHVRDEIVELAEAFLRSKGKEALEEECADVFAWLVRVANTLHISLDEERSLVS